jgi:hypothetical protein
MTEETKEYLAKKYFKEWAEAQNITGLIKDVAELEAQLRRIELLWGIRYEVNIIPQEEKKGRQYGLSERIK